MYAVYAPNRAAPLAQGGRYDGIGEHFGRAVLQQALVVTYMHYVRVSSNKSALWLHPKVLMQI
jgi:ATP phosphoribosyltransferase regulatory subunit HisZ